MYKKENLNELLEKVYYKKINLNEKNVLLRSCLNVSTDDDGDIVDDTRLIESLSMIKELAVESKMLIIVAHLGRPDGEKKKYSFRRIAERLNSELEGLSRNGKKIEIVLLKSPKAVAMYEDDGETHKVILLENIRFNHGEDSESESERMQFARSLADLADVFINDAFADYRKSASTYEIAEYLPSYLGSTFYKEIKALAVFEEPKRPFIAVLGGAKLSEKLDSLNELLEVADKVLVGGAMAYTLLKAQGGFVGDSLVEDDKLDIAVEMVYKHGYKLVLPEDHLIVENFEEPAIGRYAYTTDSLIPPGKIAVDIGPKTIELYKSIIKTAKSILANGPMGVFEWDVTSTGTKGILKSIVDNTDAFKLVGGGDSIASINKFDIKGFNYVSTGGGAMLAFLSYEEFPTLDVILDKINK